MSGEFVVALVTREPFSAAFERNRDDVAFAVVMRATRLLVNVDADYFDAMNVLSQGNSETMKFGNQKTRNRDTELFFFLASWL